MRIIDVHAHYGKWFFPIETHSIDAALKIMEKYSIEKGVFSSSRAIIYDLSEGNAELARVIQNHPQLYAYLFLNPNYVEQSLLEMEKYLPENSKFLGLKLYSNGYIAQPLNCPGHKEFLRVFEEKYPQRVVLCHCYSYSQALQLVELAQNFPTLKFIMGHMGGAEWKQVLKIVKQLDNVYLELCSGYRTRGKIEETVSQVGAERIVFGSDMTLLSPSQVIGMVQEAHISPEDKEMIFYGNAQQLFNLTVSQ